jgi:hypothetical protein
MEIMAVSDLTELERFSADWNQLALAAPWQFPMSSHAWVRTFLEHCLKIGESWICLFAYDGAKLVGVLPLVIGPYCRTLGGVPLHAPFDLHTFSVDILAAPGRASEVVPFLLSSIRRFIPSWRSLRLTRLPQPSPTLSIIEKGISGLQAVTYYDGDGSSISLGGGGDAYSAGVSRKFRRNLANARNRLTELHGVEFIRVEGQQATCLHLGEFANLEASGWKGRAGSAIKNSPNRMAFYDALTRRLGALGWLQWFFLRAEGKVIAAKLNVKFGKSLVMCKIAYDEAYARYSPGNLLMEQDIEYARQSRTIERIDLVADAEWLAHRNPQMDSYFHVRLYPARPVPLLLGYLPFKIKRFMADLPLIAKLTRAVRAALKRHRKAAPIPTTPSEGD